MSRNNNRKNNTRSRPQQRSFRRRTRRNAAARERKRILRAEIRAYRRPRRYRRPYFREIGRVVGGLVGAPNLGARLGKTVGRIFGSGDYAVSENSLVGTGGPPSFAAMNTGVRIRHREYIKDVTSSTNFTTMRYDINPGVRTTFPWLAQVAAQFEQYKVHGMAFDFNTTSAVAVSSTNTALGVVGMVTQYDPTEPDFTSKQQCENYMGCVATVPSKSLLHYVECKPRSGVLDKFYVRTGRIPSDEDLKFYDMGFMQLFTQGSQASANVGELWVTYDIEFFKPRLPTSGNLVLSDLYYISSNVANSSPLGTTDWEPDIDSNLGTTVDGANDRIVWDPQVIPAGDYLVVAMWRFSSGTGTAPPLTVSLSGGCTALTLFDNYVDSTEFAPNGTDASTNSCVAVISSLNFDGATTGYVTYGAANLNTTNRVTIIITEINGGLLLGLKQRQLRSRKGIETLFSDSEVRAIRLFLSQGCLTLPPNEPSDDELIEITSNKSNDLVPRRNGKKGKAPFTNK